MGAIISAEEVGKLVIDGTEGVKGSHTADVASDIVSTKSGGVAHADNRAKTGGAEEIDANDGGSDGGTIEPPEVSPEVSQIANAAGADCTTSAEGFA